MKHAIRAALAGAALAFTVALVVGRAMPHFGPRRVATTLLLLNAIALSLEHWFLPSSPRSVAVAVYLHTSALGGAVFSAFWSVMSERLDPHTMRGATPKIGLGATLGGLSGGIAAERGVALAGTPNALIALATISVAAAGLLQLLRSKHPAGPVTEPALAQLEPKSSSAAASKAVPYLRSVGALVALTALCSSIADFALKARAMNHFSGVPELVHFFGLFYTATSLLAFAFQALLTQPLIEKAGLGVALGGLPAALSLSALSAAVFPSVVTQVLLRGTDATLTASLYRSAYEPLFSPLPAKRRREAKVLIDVIVDRVGDALGGVAAWGLVLLLPTQAAVGASVLIVPLGLIGVYIARRVYKGYVDELASSLRAGETNIGEADGLDQATALVVSRAFTANDRLLLLEEIRKHREQLAREHAANDEANGTAPGAGPPHDPPQNSDAAQLLRAAEELSSGQLSRIQRALSAPLDVRLVPFVLPLVERADCADAVMRALAGFGESIVGQLGDALRNTATYSPAARRRFARVLSNSNSMRAGLQLVAALDDPDYHVRYQLAQGIAAMQRAGVRLPIDNGSWIAAARKELEQPSPLPINERLDSIFTLLGLAYDFEAVHLARRAMTAEDPKLRGTALEYLENVLPPSVRSELFRALDAEPPPGSRRGQQQLLAEMKRTLG